MKKNLRIVSAAAAALLAVAPVAASAVTANAAVTVNDVPAQSTPTTPAPAGTVTVNVSLNANDGTSEADAAKSVKVTVDGASIVNEKGLTYSIVDAKGNKVSKLTAGNTYYVKVEHLALQGLTTGKTYSIAGGTFNNKTVQSASDLMAGKNAFISDSFTIYNKKLTGTPVVTNNGQYVTSGSAVLTGSTATVSGLASQIEKNYEINFSNKNHTAAAVGFENIETAIKNALASNNISLKNDGNTFDVPATAFTVNLVGYANNGESVKFPVTVKVPAQTATPAASDAPVISTSNKDYKKSGNDFTRSIALPTTVTANDIAKDFTAVLNSNSAVSTKVSVKSSNLNNAVAGKYTVVLEATNNNGKTSTVNVQVTIGNPGETKTVEAGSETAKVVTITGNKVTETSNTLTNGSKVATFGTVTVDGKSYTRLNSETSDQYVETKYVDGSIKSEESKSTQVMYKSAVYNKDGNTTGKTISGYDHANLVTENGSLKVYKLAKGNFYKIANEDGYVRVRNVTGSKMTLKKNSYVYKSNGKRASKKLYKKGQTITVYGGQYKAIKKYGKKAVRVGVNRYIKVVNVNYKLAD